MLSALNPRERPRGRAAGWTHRVLAGLLAMTVLVAAGSGPALAQRMAPAEGFGDIVEKIAPAVVNISTRKDVATEAPSETPPTPQFPPGSPFEEFFKDFFERDRSQQEQQPRRNFSLGSGFVIDPTGFVVTNNHVIADADEITVIFNDEFEYPAKLIGTDSKTDLALLKIERTRALSLRQLGGQRRGPRRRLDDRHRQPVRSRFDRDRRDRVGARPRHPCRTL